MSCPNTNPINFLQELCQKSSKRFPVYSELEPTGQDHCRRFSCSCAFKGYECLGSGSDKKSAKKNAAENMIDLLQNNGFLSKFVDDEYLNKVSKKIGKTAALKNPISALMEFCVKEKMDPPQYRETEAPVGSSFFFECRINEKVTYGAGDTKKSAKTNCSAKMCELINIPFQIESGESKANWIEEAGVFKDESFINKLEEYVSKNHFKQPVYEEEVLVNDSFQITCNVGHVSGVGKDLTKEGAKNAAAGVVLTKLTGNGLQTKNGHDSPILQRALDTNEISNPRSVKAFSKSENEADYFLVEYNLSDEDTEVENNSSSAVLPVFQNLHLNNSVEEVEPTSAQKEYLKSNSSDGQTGAEQTGGQIMHEPEKSICEGAMRQERPAAAALATPDDPPEDP